MNSLVEEGVGGPEVLGPGVPGSRGPGGGLSGGGQGVWTGNTPNTQLTGMLGSQIPPTLNTGVDQKGGQNPAK